MPRDASQPAADVAGVPSRRHGHGAVAAVLAGPALVLIVLFLIGPLACVALLSLTDYQLGAATLNYVGGKNYAEMFSDRVFQKSLTNTLLYVAITVPGSVLLGLGAALLIEADRGLRTFYRAIYFLPVMATLIAMSIVWEFMLHPQFGIVNQLVKALGLSRIDWLQNQSVVLFTLCGTSIPKDLYEAAAGGGANSAIDRFRLVTWPMLSPVTLFVVVITAIRSFQVFDTVQVLTKGGPNKASEVLLYTMYSEGFEFFRSGYASAVTVVFLAFVLALSALKVFVLDKRVHYA